MDSRMFTTNRSNSAGLMPEQHGYDFVFAAVTHVSVLTLECPEPISGRTQHLPLLRIEGTFPLSTGLRSQSTLSPSMSI
jgi:hypothetical protein